jgi:hypothetical protein
VLSLDCILIYFSARNLQIAIQSVLIHKFITHHLFLGMGGNVAKLHFHEHWALENSHFFTVTDYSRQCQSLLVIDCIYTHTIHACVFYKSCFQIDPIFTFISDWNYFFGLYMVQSTKFNNIYPFIFVSLNI